MNNKGFLYKTLLLIISVGIAISSFKVANILLEYKNSNSVYDDIASFAVSKYDTQKDDLKLDEVKATKDMNFDIDFDKLQRMNKDIVGWIYLKDTPINYPVVLGVDNKYYLNHLPNNEQSSNGSIFIDSRCTNADKRFFVYGHNMRNGSMFAKLLNYSSQEYTNKHPYFYFITPEKTYKMMVYSAYYTNAESYTYSVSSPMKEYTYYIRKHSQIRPVQTVENPNVVMTLSTCAYLKGYNRFVVHCVPVE